MPVSTKDPKGFVTQQGFTDPLQLTAHATVHPQQATYCSSPLLHDTIINIIVHFHFPLFYQKFRKYDYFIMYSVFKFYTVQMLSSSTISNYYLQLSFLFIKFLQFSSIQCFIFIVSLKSSLHSPRHSLLHIIFDLLSIFILSATKKNLWKRNI